MDPVEMPSTSRTDQNLFDEFLLHVPTTQVEKWCDRHICTIVPRFQTVRRQHLTRRAPLEYEPSTTPEDNRVHSEVPEVRVQHEHLPIVLDCNLLYMMV